MMCYCLVESIEAHTVDRCRAFFGIAGACDLPRRPEQFDARETLQFFGSAMVELRYNRRTFTAGIANLLLCRVAIGLAHGQQLERSSLKLGVANKAHLYYLPVTIAESRGHLRDYGLAVAMTDFEGGG